MIRTKVFRSKILAVGVLAAFVMLFAPVEAFTQRPGEGTTGSLIGFIYGEDMPTPVENAVVKIRNIEDGKEYESTATDDTGVYRIAEVKEGHYALGVSTTEGDFNFEYIVLIKAGEMGKLSLALKPGAASTVKEVYGGRNKEGESPVGRILSYDPAAMTAEVLVLKGFLSTDRIHVKGETTDFYQDVRGLQLNGKSVERVFAGQTVRMAIDYEVVPGDLVYIKSEKKAFFKTPLGIALLVAASAVAIYGTYGLIVGAEVISPAKK